ncbi:CLUMA_CG005889, isoform A [Clunio marinus]|uniref:CLUMA_CG005889, isoform A n=1 Tax=Clunio marinus TaxID=568069 RepID=A0A1J1HXN5_9DIPT|nr:CLUMA_CG005889, isoform A [Clunio marinus]
MHFKREGRVSAIGLLRMENENEKELFSISEQIRFNYTQKPFLKFPTYTLQRLLDLKKPKLC